MEKPLGVAQVELVNDGGRDAVAREIGFAQGAEEGDRLLAIEKDGGWVRLHVGGSARSSDRTREAQVLDRDRVRTHAAG